MNYYDWSGGGISSKHLIYSSFTYLYQQYKLSYHIIRSCSAAPCRLHRAHDVRMPFYPMDEKISAHGALLHAACDFSDGAEFPMTPPLCPPSFSPLVPVSCPALPAPSRGSLPGVTLPPGRDGYPESRPCCLLLLCLGPCRLSGSLLPARAPAHCHSRKERHHMENARAVPSAAIDWRGD